MPGAFRLPLRMENGPESFSGDPMLAEAVQPVPVKTREVVPTRSRKLEKSLVDIFKLLADKTRLRIIMYLAREGELNVSSLCERLGQSQPAVSHHLALMRRSGLVVQRRTGKNNFYSIRTEQIQSVLAEVFGVLGPFENNTIRFAEFVLQYAQ
jgi:ArsR family transcriptional regulator, arsenate/arsenite/antimonite-responsive transcriptional repressor